VAADDPVVDGACDWNEAWSGEEDDGAEDEAAAAGENDSRPPRLKVRTLCAAHGQLSRNVGNSSSNNNHEKQQPAT
jgi:hypothetical protein